MKAPEEPTTMVIGSRELKTRLGSYLRRVREGARILVTDRGRPVAELRPLEPSSEPFEDRLQKLVDLGILSAIVRERPELEPFEAIELSSGSLSAAVLEDREDRL